MTYIARKRICDHRGCGREAFLYIDGLAFCQHHEASWCTALDQLITRHT